MTQKFKITISYDWDNGHAYLKTRGDIPNDPHHLMAFVTAFSRIEANLIEEVAKKMGTLVIYEGDKHEDFNIIKEEK